MTTYQEVYNPFLSKVKDPLYATLPIEASEREMLNLLNFAISEFPYSKIDLKDKDDDLQTFNNELGVDEIQILASIMAIGWFETFLNDADLLSAPALVTKDFNENSSGTHIRSLDNSLEKRRRELENKKRRYSRKDSWGKLGDAT